MNNIRYEVSQGVSMSPKTVSRCPGSISVKYIGVSKNKLRGVLRFQRNHSTAMTYWGHASAKFKKNKHQIVRFRGIFAVKQRYEILAEMSVLT